MLRDVVRRAHARTRSASPHRSGCSCRCCSCKSRPSCVSRIIHKNRFPVSFRCRPTSGQRASPSGTARRSSGVAGGVHAGQILVGDLLTGDAATLVAPDGVPAIGMKHDARSNLLFVARGASGLGTV